MAFEQTTNIAAGAAVVTSVWHPVLAGVSDIAAWWLPVLGAIWLIVQIVRAVAPVAKRSWAKIKQR